MAYVFNRTLNMMGQEPEKQDIFRSQESTTPPVAGAPTTPNSGIKTSVEGAISQQSPISGSGAQQSLQRSSLVAPKSEVIKANIGRVKAPQAAGEALSQIKQAGEGLQSESNDYLTNYSKTEAPDEGTIDRAITGGKEFSDISSLMNKSINQTEAFKPKQDIQIEKAAELSTPAGIQRSLQREADAEYTKGMGAFDLSLLGQSPEFSQTMEAIGRGQKSLYDQSQKAQEENTKQRLGLEQASLKEAQDKTKDILGAKSEDIKKASQAKEAEYDNQTAYYQGTYNPTPEQKAKWDKELSDYITSESQATKDETANVYGGADYGAYFTPENIAEIDPNQFYRSGIPETDYTQFMGQEDVNKFNTIMSLLGSNQGITKGLAPGERFNFDSAGYQKSLIDKAKERKAQEDAVKAWKEGGGLEPNTNQKEYFAPEAPPLPSVGSLAIPTEAPEITRDLSTLKSPVNYTPYADFPQIGSLAMPAMPEGEPLPQPKVKQPIVPKRPIQEVRRY